MPEFLSCLDLEEKEGQGKLVGYDAKWLTVHAAAGKLPSSLVFGITIESAWLLLMDVASVFACSTLDSPILFIPISACLLPLKC